MKPRLLAASPYRHTNDQKARVVILDDGDFLIGFQDGKDKEEIELLASIDGAAPNRSRLAVLAFIRETMRLFEITKEEL